MSECINKSSIAEFTVGEIVREFGDSFVKEYKPNDRVVKVLTDIGNCKTARLGGHYVYCMGCGYEKKVYNSCGNSNCPQCQQIKRLLWIDKTVNHLLPVRHFHVIFTLPSQLNDLFFYNQRKLYKIFFHSAWETISKFTGSGLSGMISTLHTWGSNLAYHPHLHCIVSDGGFDGEKWETGHTHNSKFYVKYSVLREKYKEIFLKKFKEFIETADGLYVDGEEIDRAGYNEVAKIYVRIKKIKDWSIRVEVPVCGQEQIVEYLGRYVSRIAITNSRITDVSGGVVSFRYKKYAQQEKGKPAPQGIRKMVGARFLQQFSQHILPRYFHRVRYFGIYAFSKKKERLSAYESIKGRLLPSYQAPLKRDVLRKLLGTDPDVCPECASYQTLITFPLELEESSRYRFHLESYWSYVLARLKQELENIMNGNQASVLF